MGAPVTLVDNNDVALGQSSTNPVQVNDAAVVALLQTMAIGSGALVVQPAGGTLSTSASGTIYSNEGASAISPFVLPGAAAGLRYGFIVQDADGIRITAASGDTIQISTAVSATAGKAESTTTGSTVFLIAVNATEWIATSVVGSWTVT